MTAPLLANSTLAAAKASEPWNSHDTRLMVVTVLGIALIVLLITVVKMHPFLALMLGSAFVGFAAGVPSAKIITNFENGVGATLQEVGLLIALGAMLGKLLADSGGADQIIDKLLSKTPPKLVPWAMSLVAVIIGLPMFFEIGLVLLLPVIVLVSQRSKLKLMRVAIPALAGLSALHGLIPPHPGPLIAIAALHAQLGTTLALGLLVAIPTVVICGPLLSIPITRWVPVDPPAVAGGVDTTKAKTQSDDVKRPPTFLVTLLTILFPVMLMLGKALADIIWDTPKNPPQIRVFFDFIGEPLVALTLGVLLAMVTFGYAVGFTGNRISSRIGASVGPIAAVLLIVGAGGGFKQTLIGAGVGDTVAKFANGANISVLVLGYLIAVALRLATGSATVATITAAGIVAPLATDLTSTHAALLALAIGCGSLFLSHVNDAGFWLVKELFGLTIGQTFKSWSVMETAVSVVGFSFVMGLSTVL
ncbi:GntP family gluconate:H+ symporter [Jatrophihabitans sp. GAS493]|uniref:GntT/GntP/DsdX family permease n=1 Tax=Jatrophihabitans sp. GAS493 TaxID=1907575 RepID=UPI000BB6F808|nr:gluconate:H+ symporter [Jatrophihabitans sp. GAS493]SOD70990.1 GntP family gluconate:H+ symporter [Jatrophihabitans sp. GAS493]